MFFVSFSVPSQPNQTNHRTQRAAASWYYYSSKNYRGAGQPEYVRRVEVKADQARAVRSGKNDCRRGDGAHDDQEVHEVQPGSLVVRRQQNRNTDDLRNEPRGTSRSHNAHTTRRHTHAHIRTHTERRGACVRRLRSTQQTHHMPMPLVPSPASRRLTYVNAMVSPRKFHML